MPVYMIRAGDTDKVKIGWTGGEVEVRRSDLQTAHYERLTVLRIIQAEAWAEQALHRQFAQFRLVGEWFRLVPQMLDVEPHRRFLPAAIKPGLKHHGSCVSVMDSLDISFAEAFQRGHLVATDIERLGAARGLTPKQICKLADVTYTTFWRWKTARSKPGIDVYQRLARVVSDSEAAPE